MAQFFSYTVYAERIGQSVIIPAGARGRHCELPCSSSTLHQVMISVIVTSYSGARVNRMQQCVCVDVSYTHLTLPTILRV